MKGTKNSDVMNICSPRFSPQQHPAGFFRFASFSMSANLSLFIFSCTSKHSPESKIIVSMENLTSQYQEVIPLFFPFLIVPVTVRKPDLVAFGEIWEDGISFDLSLLLEWSLWVRVILTPCPPIGSVFVLSVFSISIASSLAFILKSLS